jgi:hypothetical protein
MMNIDIDDEVIALKPIWMESDDGEFNIEPGTVGVVVDAYEDGYEVDFDGVWFFVQPDAVSRFVRDAN